MAPTIRDTPIPASLWASDNPFSRLGHEAQWLYLRIWTSESRDSAGFFDLQPSLWAKSSPTSKPLQPPFGLAPIMATTRADSIAPRVTGIEL